MRSPATIGWHPKRRLGARGRFILRVGILRVGLPLASIVFVWVLASQYSTTFGRLRTAAGAARLSGTLLLIVAEWMLGAGWLVGAILWQWKERSASRRDGSS